MPEKRSSEDILEEIIATLDNIQAQSNKTLLNNMISNETHSVVSSSVKSLRSVLNNTLKDVYEGKEIISDKLDQYLESLDNFNDKLDAITSDYRGDNKLIRSAEKNTKAIQQNIVKLNGEKEALVNSGVSADSEKIENLDRAIKISNKDITDLTSASNDAKKMLPIRRQTFEQTFRQDFGSALENIGQHLELKTPFHRQVLQSIGNNITQLFASSENETKEKNDTKIEVNFDRDARPGTNIETDDNSLSKQDLKANQKKSVVFTGIPDSADSKKELSKLNHQRREELKAQIEDIQANVGHLKDREGKKLNIKKQLAKQPVKSALKSANRQTSIADQSTQLKSKVVKVIKNIKKFLDPNLIDINNQSKSKATNRTNTSHKGPSGRG